MVLKSMNDESFKHINVNIRISPDDQEIMWEKADAFTAGNLSEWIRAAARNYTPRKRDLKEVS